MTTPTPTLAELAKQPPVRLVARVLAQAKTSTTLPVAAFNSSI